MNCSEFKELVWGYALNALDPTEAASCDEHLVSAMAHEGCQEALDRAYRVAPRMSAVLSPARPGPKVWQNIEARIREDRGGARRLRRAGTPIVPWAVAASAILLCGVAVSGGLALRQALHESNRQLQLAQLSSQDLKRCMADLKAIRDQADTQRKAFALLEMPSTQLIALKPQPQDASPRGSALLNQEQQKAVVLFSALRPQVGKDYELWIIRGDAKIAAGLLHPGTDGRTIAEVDSRLLGSGRPDAFAVTIEAEGGAESPHGPIVLVGAVGKG